MIMLILVYHFSYSLGDSYARNVGFNEVADINDIIILYPQMAKEEKNPRGCWDYIGKTNEQYGMTCFTTENL